MRVVPALMRDHIMPAEVRRWAGGIDTLDAALTGGMAYGSVHELYAADATDAAATAGFGMTLAIAMTADRARGGRAVLWLRSHRAASLGGVFQGHGWAELGGAPGDGLLGVMRDTLALLRTTVDALRCPALGAVVVEGWGRMPELDLTASRRLALAAERSGVPLFLLRIDATPIPSAAQTRWQVNAAPSQALPGNAPGRPTFDITLLRQRCGPAGQSWRLEWDRDRRIFREPAVSGAVVSVSASRPAADTGARAQSHVA